jgi:hypothetical protein
MNQNDMILSHLMKYGSITPREADSEYGIMRLGARIYELKRMGFAIKKETVKATNRFGDPVHFARYTMDRKEKMQ